MKPNKKNPALKLAMVTGAISIMVIGLLFLLSGDRVFGGSVMLAGVLELVFLPFVLRFMQNMNR